MKKDKNNSFLSQFLKILLYIAFLPITILYFLYKFTKKQLAENPEGVWYKQTWGIILALIFCYPAGVYFLWKYGKFQKKGKQIATACFGVLFLALIIRTAQINRQVSRIREYERELENTQSVSATEALTESDAETENIDRTVIVDEETTETSVTESETEKITETQAETEAQVSQLYSDFFEPYADSVNKLLLEDFQNDNTDKFSDYDVEITEGNEDEMWEYQIHDRNSTDYITVMFYPQNISDAPSDWIQTLTLLTYERNEAEISVNDNGHANSPEYRTFDKNRETRKETVKDIAELKTFMFSETETEEPTTEEIITEPVTEPPTEPPTEAPTVPVTQPPTTKPPAPVVVSHEYWINTESGKFHFPTCHTIKNPEDAHWQVYSGNRNDLISQGYDHCGVCDP